jgi:hypothetical protein
VKALSLWQPWAYAIMHLGKRDENRGPHVAAQARGMVGQTIAIHASQSVGKLDDFDGAVDTILDICVPPPNPGSVRADFAAPFARLCQELTGTRWRPAKFLPRGAIVGTAKLVAVHQTMLDGRRYRLLPGNVSQQIFGESPWAVLGAYQLILEDVRALDKPILRAGHQGFFDVPEGP